LFTDWVPANVIGTVKSNAAARRDYVSSILPTQLTVASSLAAKPVAPVPRVDPGKAFAHH
jgi:hypothetical protein